MTSPRLSMRRLSTGPLVVGFDDPLPLEIYDMWRKLSAAIVVAAFEGGPVCFVCIPAGKNDFVSANGSRMAVTELRLGTWPWSRRATIGRVDIATEDLLRSAEDDDDFTIGILSIAAPPQDQHEMRALVASLADQRDEWGLPRSPVALIRVTYDSYHLGLVRPRLKIADLRELAQRVGFDVGRQQ